jgi:hypothetical protein
LANLLARLRANRRHRQERSLSLDDYLDLVTGWFGFGGLDYPILRQTWTGTNVEDPSHDLPGYAALMRACPPAFAAQMVRGLVISQARFVFRNNRRSPTPGRRFGTTALGAARAAVAECDNGGSAHPDGVARRSRRQRLRFAAA